MARQVHSRGGKIISEELSISGLARRGGTVWSLTGQRTRLSGLPLIERGERNARQPGLAVTLQRDTSGKP